MKNKMFIFTSSLSLLLLMLVFFSVVVIPEHPLVYQILSLLFIFSIVINILIKKREILSFINSKYWNNLSKTLVSIFLVFIILSLVNYIAVKKPVVFDISDRKLNSLSDQTQRVLESKVADKVEFIIFSSQNNREKIWNFLELFQNSNQKIIINHFDPILRPDLTQKYSVVQAPSIVLKRKSAESGKHIVVTDLREISITNGLIRLYRDRDPLLCFIKDDSFVKTGETGFSQFFNLLNQSSFQVRQLDLLKESEISASCSAIIRFSMSRNLLKSELDKIKNYYNRGGVVLGTFSPMFKNDLHQEMREFFEENLLQVHNDIVIDKEQNISGSNGSAPFVTNFDRLGVNFNRGQKVFFPLSNSISSSLANENFLSLASTSESSWVEKTLIELLADSIKYDDKDVPGPVHMAAAIVKEDRPRLIALGNSSFVSNKFIKYSTNFTFILNIFHWIAGEDTLTSLNSAVFKEEPIFISSTQKNLILFISIIGMPVLFLFVGIFQYRRGKQ